MCGIIGYTGQHEAGAILVQGLQRLVYRGYDSAGVAIQNGTGMEVRKVAGEVEGLANVMKERPIRGTSGIGHTRWATHGPPTERNAHPHRDCSGEIALVHNGIIENADALRTHLTAQGHTFETDTDTEVLTHLIEDERGPGLEERVLGALRHVEGTYGIAVMSSKEPGKIVAARKGSPLLIGIGESGIFVSSDVAGVLEHTSTVVYLEDGDMATLTPDGYRILDAEASPLTREVTTIDWELEELELGGYDHFMQKEIHEQPDAIRRALAGRLSGDDGNLRLDGLNLDPEDVEDIDRILIVACGTSWHAGLIGRNLIEELAGIPVQVEYASEFRYGSCLVGPRTLTVAISQSGETADTLEAVRAAKAAGSRVVGLVNVVGSTISRECEGGLYLHAGPEIGVASTKAFTSQVTCLLLLALFLADHRGRGGEEVAPLVRAGLRLPELVSSALELDDEMRELAPSFVDAGTVLYLGRGISFPVALEGALKLKEISYIHAEGYPAAEDKHGPIALVEEGVPVVFVAPRDDLFPKILSTVEEIRARGGRTVVITTHSGGGGTETEVDRVADQVIRVPGSHALLSPVLTVIPLQLLAYHVARLRGCNVDRPRNLAKSVTVE